MEYLGVLVLTMTLTVAYVLIILSNTSKDKPNKWRL